MAYGLVDDKLHGHRKFARAGCEAAGLWLFCHSWVCDNLTDGFIPLDIAVRYAGGARKAEQLAKKLVEAGLWEQREDGYHMHDYLDHNPSADEVLAKREKERVKKEKQRNGKRDESGKFTKSTEVSPGDTGGDSTGESRDCPSVPTPTPVPREENKQTHAGARVDEPGTVPRWFVEAWRKKSGVAFIDPNSLIAVWGCVDGYATSTSKPPEEVTPKLLDAYERITAEWDSAHRWVAHLFVKHFDVVQAEVAKPAKKPAPRDNGKPPQERPPQPKIFKGNVYADEDT